MSVSSGPEKQFAFFPASGARISVDLNDVPMTGRISRRGQRVMCFPAPFETLEITDGERVGPAKLARIRAAVLALGGIMTEN